MTPEQEALLKELYERINELEAVVSQMVAESQRRHR